MSSDHVVVISTTDTEQEARDLAAGVVRAKLGACVQIVGPIISVFRWDDDVQTEQEWRLEVKTAADRVVALREHITAHHSYDVPEFVVLPVSGGSDDYLAWVTSETR